MRIQDFLKSHDDSFTAHEYPGTTSAQRLAHAFHEPEAGVAKTVVVKADGEFMLTVVPANCDVDLEMAKAAIGTVSISLATEDEVAELFTDCEVGAVPPFGAQYGLTTLVDESLSRQSHLLFEGNCHTEAIRMRYPDFEKLENPLVVRLGRARRQRADAIGERKQRKNP